MARSAGRSIKNNRCSGCFLPTGEVLSLLTSRPNGAGKSYKTSDRSGVVERFVRETYEARQEVGDGLHLSKKHIILGFIFGT